MFCRPSAPIIIDMSAWATFSPAKADCYRQLTGQPIKLSRERDDTPIAQKVKTSARQSAEM
jgi:hypothetical protein